MKILEKILKSNKELISDISDLTGGEEPSALFYFLIDTLGYLLQNEPDKVLSKKGVNVRRNLNCIIKLLGAGFLRTPQVIENRNVLLGISNEPDKGISLPNEPVIWTANHAFKDDTLATILAAKRHTYILFGSLPQFYNSFDGITAWINGVVMVNRKVKESRQASIEKAVRVMEYGADLMMFPEGVWNKTPNKLMLDLWPGVYRVSKETGAKVVPIVHYIRDCVSRESGNIIHTVVDEPIRIDDLSEKAALNYLRDVISTWYFLMMEKYGKSTREKELGSFVNSKEAWEYSLIARVKTAQRYDCSIEYIADYRPKEKRLEDIWQDIAAIQNITKDNALQVEYARQILKEIRENDFQRRF